MTSLLWWTPLSRYFSPSYRKGMALSPVIQDFLFPPNVFSAVFIDTLSHFKVKHAISKGAVGPYRIYSAFLFFC